MILYKVSFFHQYLTSQHECNRVHPSSPGSLPQHLYLAVPNSIQPALSEHTGLTRIPG